jgi:hypothetical protein
MIVSRLIVALFLVIVAPTLAAAQQNQPVYQSGSIARGRAGYWINNGVIGDAGPANAGNITELGLTNTGTPFCINDQLTTNPTGYHQFCLGALALGGGLMNYGAYNGATPLPFTVSTGGPLIFNSAINDIEAKNLPLGLGGAVQLCISPTTGVLSIATGGAVCGGNTPPPQYVLLQGGAGYILLQGGAGRILLQ